MTDEELNIAIAEKLMGATVRRAQILSGAGTVVSATKDGLVYNIPRFATDWRAFGLVVEVMAKRGWEGFEVNRMLLSHRFVAAWSTVASGVPERYVKAEDTTRLRAACLAAIKAVESEVQP